jgi:FtsZ-binding cell division protein ZapB
MRKIELILHDNNVHYDSVKLGKFMKKNITLSAEENIIKKARQRARKQNTTLNNEFRKWLERYASDDSLTGNYTLIMNRLEYVKAGKHFTREELNER